jgi:rhodanese-related sulfurtransferase
MKSLACRLSFVLFVVAASSGSARAGGTVTEVDVARLGGLVASGVTIVDVRRPEEWRETGVIDGSALITAFDANGRLIPSFPAALAAAAERDEEVVLICRSGNRSRAISRLLAEHAGYTHVMNANGGILAWIAAGKPVTPCPSC